MYLIQFHKPFSTLPGNHVHPFQTLFCLFLAAFLGCTLHFLLFPFLADRVPELVRSEFLEDIFGVFFGYGFLDRELQVYCCHCLRAGF